MQGLKTKVDYKKDEDDDDDDDEDKDDIIINIIRSEGKL